MHLFHDAREMSEWKGDMTYEKTTDAEVIKPVWFWVSCFKFAASFLICKIELAMTNSQACCDAKMKEKQ